MLGRRRVGSKLQMQERTVFTGRLGGSSRRLLRALSAVGVALACAACVNAGEPAQAASLANFSYAVAQQFEVDLKPQPVAIGRVSPSGIIYLVDVPDSAVVAYRQDGEFLWRTEIAPEQLKRSPIGIDLDAQGNLLVLESYASDIHVLDKAGRFVKRIPLSGMGSRLVPRPSGMFAAGPSGELLVLNTDRESVQEVDSSGQVRRGFGATTSAEDARAGGWLRFRQDTVYHRRAGTLTFDVHSSDGRLLKTISPRGIPYQPPSLQNEPGDQVFTTDLLPDGKIVVEIAHRTPYEVVQQEVRMAVTLGIYVVDLDGRSLDVAAADWTTLGG
jgi:hypothetical protein